MTDDADLLIVNGRVFIAFGPGELAPYGSDIGPRPVAAPTGVAIAGGRIVGVARDEELLRDRRGPRTTVVDARGGLITAGFDDDHIHVMSGARSLDQVDLFRRREILRGGCEKSGRRDGCENRSAKQRTVQPDAHRSTP